MQYIFELLFYLLILIYLYNFFNKVLIRDWFKN
jgi:hypothetical protein